MSHDDPTDPHAWLQHARSNLRLAEKGGTLRGVLLEDLCFNAQQAAEKAFKAVCVKHDLEFPKTHSLVRLIDILEIGGVKVPKNIKEADVLTQYAVESRYPSISEEVTKEEYQDALELAARVLFWAVSVIA